MLHRPGLKDSNMPEPLEPGIFDAVRHAAPASPSLASKGSESISCDTDDSANLGEWKEGEAGRSGEKAWTIRGYRVSPAVGGRPFVVG